MGLYEELKEAIEEETERMEETEGFRRQFAKLIENYMDGMGAEAEIADVIGEITLPGDEDEN